MMSNALTPHEELAMTFRIINASDVRPPPPDTGISVTEDYINLTYGGYDYDIERDRVKNADELLCWVHDLSEKTWMDRDRLRHFIRVAGVAQGIRIYGL